ALEMGLERKDGAAALLAAGERLPGLIGSLAELIDVEPGHETAVAAALGAASDAVAVDGHGAAETALALLREGDAGRAGIVVAAAPESAEPRSRWPEPPEGLRYARDAVTAPEALAAAVTALLDRVVLVADAAQARAVRAADPRLSCATADGDVFGPVLVRGGSASAPSLLEVQAAVEEAGERIAAAAAECERAAAGIAEAEERRAAAKTAVAELDARRRQADKRRNEIAGRLGKLGGQARAAEAEVERYAAAAAKAAAGRTADLDRLAEQEQRLAAAEAEPAEDGEEDTGIRDELAAAATEARRLEMEARLAVRTAEERVRSIAGRADGLLRQAEEEREARLRAERRRRLRAEQSRVAEAVAQAARMALDRIGASLAEADARRAEAEQRRAERDAELKTVRARVRELSVELEKLVNVVHGSEVARAERKLRLEQL